MRGLLLKPSFALRAREGLVSLQCRSTLIGLPTPAALDAASDAVIAAVGLVAEPGGSWERVCPGKSWLKYEDGSTCREERLGGATIFLRDGDSPAGLPLYLQAHIDTCSMEGGHSDR